MSAPRARPLPPVRTLWRTLLDCSLSSLVTAPVIYLGIVPIVAMDLFVTFYQWVCFKDFGLKRVPRAGFIIFDRHKLGYLNWIERINCDYCAYFNGVLAYAVEVAGHTERHFCPIRNAARRKNPHAQYARFTAYGDGEAYEKIVKAQLESYGIHRSGRTKTS